MGSYGKVKHCKILYKQSCGFVTFATREHAELAIQALHDKFFLKNHRLKLLWAKHHHDFASLKQRFNNQNLNTDLLIPAPYPLIYEKKESKNKKFTKKPNPVKPPPPIEPPPEILTLNPFSNQHSFYPSMNPYALVCF